MLDVEMKPVNMLTLSVPKILPLEKGSVYGK